MCCLLTRLWQACVFASCCSVLQIPSIAHKPFLPIQLLCIAICCKCSTQLLSLLLLLLLLQFSDRMGWWAVPVSVPAGLSTGCQLLLCQQLAEAVAPQQLVVVQPAMHSPQHAGICRCYAVLLLLDATGGYECFHITCSRNTIQLSGRPFPSCSCCPATVLCCD